MTSCALRGPARPAGAGGWHVRAASSSALGTHVMMNTRFGIVAARTDGCITRSVDSSSSSSPPTRIVLLRALRVRIYAGIVALLQPYGWGAGRWVSPPLWPPRRPRAVATIFTSVSGTASLTDDDRRPVTAGINEA